jgi:branched-chain amino acid transport system permease protein
MLEQVLEYAALGIMLGAIYALLAVGYSLVFGVLNKLNLAHGDIYMSGAFAAAWFAPRLPGWLVVPIGILFSTALGVLLYLIVFRPVRDRRELLGPAIGSQAFGMVLSTVAAYLAGGYTLQFPTILRLPEIHYGDVQISSVQIVVLALALAAMLAFQLIVQHSRFGREMRTIAENEEAAHLLGINVQRVIIQVFALSSATAGLAAILYALRYGVVDPYAGFQMGLIGLIVMVLGGVGNIPGALCGGLLLGLIQMLAAGLLWPGAQQVVPWIVLVVVLVVLPRGLFGGRQIQEKV